MAVNVISKNVVEVTPDEMTVVDILDFAIAAIEVHGWRKGGRTSEEDFTVGGLSLHDAIGYAGQRLADDKESHGLRDTATMHVINAIGKRRLKGRIGVGKGMNDRQFNDQAKNVGEVLDVLRKAKKEAERANR